MEYKRTIIVPLRKILDNNQDTRITCTDLRILFSAFGCVEECSIYKNIWHIPCAYITFKKEKDALRAMTEHNIISYTNYLRVRSAAYCQQPENLDQLLLTSNILNKIQNSPRNSYNRNDDLWDDIDKPSLNVLDDDCLRHIFSFLPIIDKLRVEIVCKRWKSLSLESWSTMRTLDFSTSKWGMSKKDIISISTFGLCGVLSRCGKYLREINLEREMNFKREKNLPYRSIPQSFTTDILYTVGKYCPNLKKFDITALMMTAAGIDALTRTCPNLTIVVLRTWYNINNIDTSLKKFFKKVVKLEHFQISDSNFTGKCLLLMPKETMHTFIIDGCEVHDEYLSEALKRLINLRNLQIIDCDNVNDLTMSVINNYCTNLRTLKLKYLFQVPMTEFNHTKLTNLEVLSIRYNYHLTDDILCNIVQRCSKLTNINVEDCPVTIGGVSVIQLKYHIPIKFRYFDRSMHNQES